MDMGLGMGLNMRLRMGLGCATERTGGQQAGLGIGLDIVIDACGWPRCWALTMALIVRLSKGCAWG